MQINKGFNEFKVREEADRQVYSAFTSNYKICTYKATEDKYSYIDEQLTGITQNGISRYDIEIKSRDSNRLYNDCILEVEKYNKLMRFSLNEEKIYFVIYPKLNKIYIWNMNDFTRQELISIYNPKFLCNERTSNNRTVKVEKKVFHLPFNRAKAFNFDSFKWYKEIYDYLNNKQKK